MNLAEAISLDVGGHTQLAAAAYEDVLLVNPDNPIAAINLLVLYWQATDYGASTAEGLPSDFVALAARRVRQILAEAPDSLRNRPETLFWGKYITWADFGTPYELEECRALLLAHPNYLEPAIYLFASSEGKEAEAQASLLRTNCESRKTARCRYALSVIEGVFGRRRPKQHRP